MSRPANIFCPCDGAAFETIDAYIADFPDCDYCFNWHRSLQDGKCLGSDGWPILAVAGAEVARERGGKRT